MGSAMTRTTASPFHAWTMPTSTRSTGTSTRRTSVTSTSLHWATLREDSRFNCVRGDKTEDGGGVSQRKDLKDDFDELECILIESLVQVGWRWQRPCYGRHAQRLGRQVGVCRAKRGGEAHGTEARHCVRVSRRRQAALSQGDGQVLGVPVDFLTCQRRERKICCS